jgi:hypothetical protein
MNGTMPVIEVTQPMTPLLDNIQLKDIDMIKVKNITNSATMNCKVEPTFVRLITSNCSCSLCNGMYLIDSQGKVNQDACPCYTKRTAYSTLLLALNLKLTDMKSGKTYEINNHCDFAFQTSFLMTVCRAKVSHDHLNANVAFMNDLTTVVSDVFGKGNEHGWKCVVFYKIGEHVDGVDTNQNPGYGAKQDKVTSTNLVLHLAKMQLVNPTAYPQAEWNAMKFDTAAKRSYYADAENAVDYDSSDSE